MSIFQPAVTMAVAVALLVPAGCGGARPAGDGELEFVPATYREGDSVVLPVAFPDGTSAELVYPPDLEIAELSLFPYSSGRLQGKSPIPGRSDIVGRDFSIRYGDLASILTLRNGGTLPKRLAEYDGVDGQVVGLWDIRPGRDLTAEHLHYLGFQFGHWAVLVYDYVSGGGQMTDAERASWASSFSGHETEEGFLVLEGSGPLRLARAREHAGPELIFAAGSPTRDFALFPGECRPHRDQTQLVAGKLVSWNGGFANWCLSDSMRIHAVGSREFIGAVIRELEVRNVSLAES